MGLDGEWGILATKPNASDLAPPVNPVTALGTATAQWNMQ